MWHYLPHFYLGKSSARRMLKLDEASEGDHPVSSNDGGRNVGVITAQGCDTDSHHAG